jgi:uncharacterized protein
MMVQMITNTTRQTQLATRAIVARDPLSRLVGLLGHRNLAKGSGLVLQPCSSIHMFGMRFGIDAIYVDRNNTVVRVVPNLLPWQIGPIEPLADYIIELPLGTVNATQTQIGDQLQRNELLKDSVWCFQNYSTSSSLHVVWSANRKEDGYVHNVSQNGHRNINTLITVSNVVMRW